MAQKTNLNVSPYYDDFDTSKNFHKVLYRPGFAVQARELTTQQSILQNQVEEMGRNIFNCLLYTSPSPRDGRISRMPSSA